MSDIKYIHIRGKDKPTKGGATFAYMQHEDGSWSYAAAYCHPGDNFCRRTGRVKAAGRLNSARFSLYLPNTMSEEDVRDHLFNLTV